MGLQAGALAGGCSPGLSLEDAAGGGEEEAAERRGITSKGAAPRLLCARIGSHRGAEAMRASRAQQSPCN